jgi:hypothetical protein
MQSDSFRIGDKRAAAAVHVAEAEAQMSHRSATSRGIANAATAHLADRFHFHAV